MSRFANLPKCLLMIAMVATLPACKTVVTSQLEAAVPGTTMSIRGVERSELPRTEDLKSKATGQYEFMATAPDGKRMYGLLPLRVNGQSMAISILFFAPGLALGGFRDALPVYQVDPANNVLKFKVQEGDEWRQYQPLEVESARAKAYFDGLTAKKE